MNIPIYLGNLRSIGHSSVAEDIHNPPVVVVDDSLLGCNSVVGCKVVVDIGNWEFVGCIENREVEVLVKVLAEEIVVGYWDNNLGVDRNLVLNCKRAVSMEEVRVTVKVSAVVSMEVVLVMDLMVAVVNKVEELALDLEMALVVELALVLQMVLRKSGLVDRFG